MGENCPGVQPCVEINLRYNMGIVSIALQRYLQEGVEGVLKYSRVLHFLPMKREKLCNRWRRIETDYPILTDGKQNNIFETPVSGYIKFNTTISPVEPG